MSDESTTWRARLRRRLAALIPPEPPYPAERLPPARPGASWTERFEAADVAEKRRLDADPHGKWHVIRALTAVVALGLALVFGLIELLVG